MKHPALKDDVAALEARIRELGGYERPLWPVLRSWLLGLVLGLGGLWVFMSAEPLWLRCAAMVISTAGFVAMATIGHTASHEAASERPFVSAALFYATYPFLLSVSACYWRHSHQHAHHGSPNIVGVDPDCDLRPVFAVNEEHHTARPQILNRLQGPLLPLIVLVNGFTIQLQGWMRLVSELRDPRLRRPAAWADLLLMITHVLVFVVAPVLVFGARAALVTYAIRIAMIGTTLFGVLAPGHFPPEAAFLHRSQRHAGDFWLRQTATTIDFRTGLIGRWLCSGLEYQIEHHLFPRLSHLHYPAVRPLVAALCEKHGLPHRTLGWGEAIWKSWMTFFRPKPVVLDVESLRRPARRR